jgi:hypothetical protein
MEVIGHNHWGIEMEVRVALGYLLAPALHQITGGRQVHRTGHDAPQQWQPVLNAERDEIASGAGVVIAGQALLSTGRIGAHGSSIAA